MRVLVVCDFFLKYAADQAHGLAHEGITVGLLHRDHADEFGGDELERRHTLDCLADSGVRLFELPGRVTAADSIGRVRELRAAVRAWRPDVVHAHENVDPRLLATVWGLPLVVTVHDPVPHPGAPRRSLMKRGVRRVWLRRAQRIVVHGTELVSELAPRLRRRAVVIPHGAFVAANPAEPPPRPCVLLFGRLQPYKGVEVLAEAMSLLWGRRGDLRLVVCGDGPAAAAVPDDPRAETISGYLPDHEVDGMLRSASVVVLPYTQASASGVGALATARGIPTVVTAVGALPGLVPSSDFIVPPGDAVALAAAIEAAVDAPIDVREQFRQHAASRISWAAVSRRSISLYRSVVTP